MSVARAVALALALTTIAAAIPLPAGPSAAAGQPVTISRIRIEGPTLVAPGESPRYAAIVEYSDGSSKDVTATASWFPNGASFPINFASPGIAAPAQRGEALVVANAGTIGRLTALVLEPGTFKVTGLVSEAGVGALDGAMVEVLSGVGQGLQATSNSKGYALYGVSGPVRLGASADGFTPQVHDVVVTGNDATEAFILTPADSTVDVSGAWTMTLSPSPACRAGLPEIGAKPDLPDGLIQQATRLQVRITSPTLRQDSTSQHSGTVLGSRLRFVFVGDSGTEEGWIYPDLIDYISATEKFGFTGFVEGTANGSDMRATMDGDLVYWVAPTLGATWWCRAKDHIVTLRR